MTVYFVSYVATHDNKVRLGHRVGRHASPAEAVEQTLAWLQTELPGCAARATASSLAEIMMVVEGLDPAGLS